MSLDVEGRTLVEGEFIDTVFGIPGSRTEIVVLRVSGGGTGIELAGLVTPEHEAGLPVAMANELGLPTAMEWSAGSVSTTEHPGGWPMCAGPRESSSR